MLRIFSNFSIQLMPNLEDFKPEDISYNPIEENEIIGKKWNNLSNQLLDAQKALGAGYYSEFVEILSNISNFTSLLTEEYRKALEDKF